MTAPVLRLCALTAILCALSCTPAIVRAVPKDPIVPSPETATLVVISGQRERHGPAWIADVAGNAPPHMLGEVEPWTHFVVQVPAGRHMFVAYDDDSYEAIEGELAPGAIYSVGFEHSGLDVVLRPYVPNVDPIRRLLDETARVVLAEEQPKPDELDRMQKKVVLARYRYGRENDEKRARRFVRPEHAWR